MTDTFRKEYKELTEKQKEVIRIIKERADDLDQILVGVNTPDIGRMIALARTNLEQSVMWAVKAITS